MTTHNHDATAEAPTTPRRALNPRVPWIVGALAAIALVGVVVGAAVGRDESAAETGQIASIRHACEQWHDADAQPAMPPTDWCSDMAGWMTGRMGSDPAMDHMMWGDPSRMRSTCQQWMTTTGSDSSDEWCARMVDWMAGHTDDWNAGDGWMMHRPMTGR